jgi:hypothetical protein
MPRRDLRHTVGVIQPVHQACSTYLYVSHQAPPPPSMQTLANFGPRPMAPAHSLPVAFRPP